MHRTILIVHPGTLGDVLLALPAIRALQMALPTHELGMVAGAEVGGLLRACGEVEAVLPLEGDALAGLLAGPESVGPIVHQWLSRCDLGVCWMADPDNRLSSTLQGLGAGCVIARSPASLGHEAIHQTDRVLQTVRDVALMGEYGGRLHLPDVVIAGGRTRLATAGTFGTRPLVAIHPGSGSRHKCADPALLAGAVEWFQTNEAYPVLVGGPADEGMIANVSDACATRPAILQHLDLLSIAGVLAHADLFVGHDSGLTHLAAALHLPTVALFGPTDRRRWAPRGPHVTILTGEPCRCEGWNVVQECRDKPCLRIPAEKLVGTCEQLLRRPRMVSQSPLEATLSPCSAQ